MSKRTVQNVTSVYRQRPASLCSRCRAYATSAPARTARSEKRPLRLGVVGSGPAGFYAAGRVMQKLPAAKVDMYEQLPVPFGLVRYGVAPDHPEVKNCQDKFEEIAELSNFNFIGNVKVGEDIPLTDLAANYDALLFAYGASEDKELGIPGEKLKGIFSARSFVGWYNGLPEFRQLDVETFLNESENAVVLGQGNVSLDVARVLLTDADELRKTDMAAHAVETLSRSKVRRVQVIGRRGPMQAAFTIRELRELLTLPEVSFDKITCPPMPSATEVSSLPRQQKRIAQLLAKGSSVDSSAATKSWALKFLSSPSNFQPSALDSSRLGSISFTTTRFKTGEDPSNRGARVESDPNFENDSITTSLAFRSVGYKSRPLRAFSSVSVPFDEQRGIIPNDLYGRVLATQEDTFAAPGVALTPTQRHVPGMYCGGWVKRGPTGVIASTMEDAHMTADAIVQDWETGVPFKDDTSPGEKIGWNGIEDRVLSSGARPVTWKDWKSIDRAEKNAGKSKGKIREKIVDIKDMLRVLDE